MKERPILFSGPMVRAILEGRKTQTRRVVKPQPFMVLSAADWHSRAMSGVDPYGCRPMGSHVLEEMGATCPHGTVGDRLWVRETWSPSTSTIPLARVPKADPRATYDVKIWYAASNDRPTWAETKWRPSIHMPRWASRIMLEITGVRVERLREISEEDAIAEGVSEIVVPGIEYGPYGDPVQPLDCSATDRDRFDHLWQSIHGAESWFANPWVWVIEFRRVEQC